MNSNEKNQKMRQDATEWMAENEETFGRQRTRHEVLEEMKQMPGVYEVFQALSEILQEEFLEFCMGVRGMNITYDPVFKKICSPEEHPDRLTEFLGLCLNKKLKILQVLPNESRRLTEDGSLLVMDILVRLETGEVVNVEIQRMGYLFPGERCACYSSDLVMRQYVQVRTQKREEGKRFSYKDIKNVYTIVLIQKSTSEFHAVPDEYLHYGKQVFNTGLKLNMLQEYLLIPLDIFRKTNHNISSKLDAWLTFLSSDSPEDIRRLVEAYPEFKELYREVFQFRYHVKELVSMFSEELSILDANTVQYMIELQQEELEAKRVELEKLQAEVKASRAELETSRADLETSQADLETNRAELETNRAELETNRAELETNRAELETNRAELEMNRAELETNRAELETSQTELERLKQENARLKELLAQNAR